MLAVFLLLASLSRGPVVHTLSLRHVAPSLMSQRLFDPTAAHPLTEGLERLSPDDTRKTLTLSGPPEVVKTVEQAVRWLDVPTPRIELEVEIMEFPGKPLQGRALVSQNTQGTLLIFGRQSRYQLQVSPHLNGDGTCSMAIGIVCQKRGTDIAQHSVMSGISSYFRVALGKSLNLGLGSLEGIEVDPASGRYVRRDKDQPPTLRVRITPRVKK